MHHNAKAGLWEFHSKIKNNESLKSIPMTSYDHTTITQLRTDTYKRNVVSVRSHTPVNHVDFRKGCLTKKVMSNWPDAPFSRLPFPLKQRKFFPHAAPVGPCIISQRHSYVL